MSSVQTTLLDCEYFPSIEWYKDYLTADEVLIEQYEYFVRASGRNRCYVCGPNGKIALTVPLLGGRNQKTLMKDVKISYDEKWQHQHWYTLDACYRRTPFFEYFEQSIFGFYQKKHTFLLDLNLNSIEVMNQLMKLKNTLLLSNEYVNNIEDHNVDKRNRLKLKSVQIEYLQPFGERHGFVSGLSMLDLLFCMGNRSKELILIS